MNDEWIKVDDLTEVDDLAERIQEIEQEKEMWKSILDSYNLQYKFEIGEHEEKKVDQFCIGNVYTLELWVTESYYQMAKEIVDEVKNAPSADDAWELQNEIPIEDEEGDETVKSFQDNKTTNKNIVFIIYTIMIIVLILSIFVALKIQEVNPDLAMIIPLIVFAVIIIVIIIITIIMIIKRRKE